MAALAIVGLAIGKELLGLRITRSRWLWIILGVLVRLILVGIWLSWKQIAPEGMANPLEVMRWWIKKSAEWQAHLSERASGKIQAIFDRTPAWAHLPMLLAYGVAQPFLPATLVDVTAAAIWRAINIWRSLGWTVLLALLLYAPLLAWRRKGDRAWRAGCALWSGSSSWRLHTAAELTCGITLVTAPCSPGRRLPWQPGHGCNTALPPMRGCGRRPGRHRAGDGLVLTLVPDALRLPAVAYHAMRSKCWAWASPLHCSTGCGNGRGRRKALPRAAKGAIPIRWWQAVCW